MIEILSVKAWALETRFFNRMAPIVLGRIGAGKDLDILIQPNHLQVPTLEAGQKQVQVNKSLYYVDDIGYAYMGAEEDSFISRTEISGTISKNGGMCSLGTKQLGERLQLLDQKDSVKGHVLLIESPGGAVDGTPEFANIIANLSKPVVAYVDSMAASAAYWIASQTDHIVTNSLNYTEVGSIGTLAVMTNEQGYLKKEGLKVEIMRADRSVDKARLNSVEEWPEESLQERKEFLNTVNADFIATVNRGRNGRLSTLSEDIFTGRMYDQKRALAMGMIDQIGTLEDALTKARELSKTNKTTKIKP